MLKNINHIWLFITDRCNLGCGYCFYKYRTQNLVMPYEIFKDILDYIRPITPAEFVFSGGEPLMEAKRLKDMISTIRQDELSKYISVQTNATLLDKSLLNFFSDHEVNLEFGIDGDEETTLSSRPGIGAVDYTDIIRGINLALKAGGSMTTTMVVNPSNVSKLMDNLKHLDALGLKSIEIHPAFLESWNSESSAVFLDQYRQACAWEIKERLRGLIGRGYSEPARGAWDLLALPNGKILGNWLLLSFPEQVREHLYLMDFGIKSSSEFLPQAKPYFHALDDHLAKNPSCSYRSISNFNAIYAAKTHPGRKYKQRVREYIDLCERIEAIDRKIMKSSTWQ